MVYGISQTTVGLSHDPNDGVRDVTWFVPQVLFGD